MITLYKKALVRYLKEINASYNYLIDFRHCSPYNTVGGAIQVSGCTNNIYTLYNILNVSFLWGKTSNPKLWEEKFMELQTKYLVVAKLHHKLRRYNNELSKSKFNNT